MKSRVKYFAIIKRLKEPPRAEDDAGKGSLDPLAAGKTSEHDLDAIVEVVPEAQEVGAELQPTLGEAGSCSGFGRSVT